jgi:hypothetical protein
MKIEKTIALAFLAVHPHSNMIEQIMKDSDYNDEVCAEGVKQLARRGYKSEDWLRLMAGNRYPKGLLRACSDLISLKDKSEEEVFAFLGRVDYHWFAYKAAIEALDPKKLSQEKLIILLSRFYRDEVYAAYWPYVQLEGKSEDEIWGLLRILGFNLKAEEKIVPLISKEEYLLKIILDKNDSSLYDDLRALCFKRLHLEKKSEDELTALAESTKFNHKVACEIIKHLKTEEKIFWLTGACKYAWDVSVAAISKLGNETYIMLITRENPYVVDVCVAAIEKVSEKHLMEIWDWHSGHKKEISQAIIKRLDLRQKTENEIIGYIKKDLYNDSACKASKPYLKLKEKTPSEMIALLQKTDYSEAACRLFLPSLGLKKMGEEEIFSLFKKSHSHPQVGKVLIKFVSSEEYILKFVQEASHHNSIFWTDFFANLLKRKSDKEIFEILKILRNDQLACRIAIGFQRKKNYILETIMASGYEEKTVEIGLKKLKDINPYVKEN